MYIDMDTHKGFSFVVMSNSRYSPANLSSVGRITLKLIKVTQISIVILRTEVRFSGLYNVSESMLELKEMYLARGWLFWLLS